MPDFSLDEVTRELISAQHAIADQQNKIRIMNYNYGVAGIKADNEQRIGLKLPLLPLPTPPMLMVIDDDKIVEIEQTDNGDIQFWHFEQYKPPFHVVLPKLPDPVVIDTAHEVPGYPGFFEAASGDGVAVAPGTRIIQDGTDYIKFTFGPFGSAMWQRQAPVAQAA
jgi:hypothetical protein